MALNVKMPRFFGGSPGNAEPALGHDPVQLVGTLHGKHYEDCLEGRVFSHTPTPLGLAIPIYTGTALAGGMPIWNRTGSGVNLELISATIAASATGTAAVGSYGLMVRLDVGSQLTTGSEITAFAKTDPVNGLLGGGNASKVWSSNAGTVTVTAGVAAEFTRTIFGSGVAAQNTANGISFVHHDFEGTVIVPPGTLVWIAGVLASVRLYNTTLVWKELPI